MKIYNHILIAILLTSMGFWGCRSSNSPTDTPTTGTITISVDETFKPLIDSEVNTFNSIYTYANVKVNYKPEAEAFNDLMNDTTRLIITSRNLNKEELEQFKKWEIVPNITKIAYDGVALIGSTDIGDTTLTIDEVKSVLEGTAAGTLKNTKIVFDNSNSSTVTFLTSKAKVGKLSKNCYALNSNTAVLDYVKNGKNTIGVIGVNWISDQDDTTNVSFMKSVKVLELAQYENDDFYKPYQAYIKQKVYPLWREVYILSKEAYTGLGAGFTAFVASERGQRIVLKFGLVPATMPVRLVEFVPSEDIPN